MNDNPLASAQRESSGAITFGKYEYQYHWALCRIIEEQRNTHEYAIFMEYHEDVVIADSLNQESATFEFNQVKNISTPKYSIKNLTKRKNGKKSVLGKLIASAINKPFSEQVSTINLVASCGFKIDQLDNDLNLEIITIGDLSKESIEQLKKSLNEELGIKAVPENLRFIISGLTISDQQDSVIGKISTLVSELFPGSHCNAENIYRILIDELHRKGQVHYDYSKWDDLLDKKALTSTKVASAISTHVSLHDIQTILSEASEIAHEMGFNYLQKKRLKKNIERIHMQTIGFPSSNKLKISKSIFNALSLVIEDVLKPIEGIIDEAINILPQDIKRQIGNIDDIKSNIIYEIIKRDI